MRCAPVMLALYVVYKWLMSREKQLAYNRFVILMIYGATFIVPAVPSVARQIAGLFAAPSGDMAVGGLMLIGMAEVSETSRPLWPAVVTAIYFAGVLAVVAMTLVSAVRLRTLLRGECRTLPRGFRLVITDNSDTAPFSWRRSMVMSRDDYARCGDTIALHELAHLSQRHWIDMLVAQVAVALQWFNPAAWLMRDELRSVHEFQADNAVLCAGVDARQYQMMLIKKAVGRRFPALANSLNHSNLKKRITMMLKSKSSKGRKALVLALVPAAVLALSVTNLPAVAGAISSVQSVDWTHAAADGKVTKNIEQADIRPQDSVTEIETVAVADEAASSEAPVARPETKVEKPAAEAAPAEAAPATPDTIAIRFASSAAHWSDGEKSVSDAANGYRVTLNGEEISYDDLKKISPDQIASMSIDKPNNIMKIVLHTDKPAAEILKRQMPRFPGGDKALLDFIVQNVKYPDGVAKDGKKHRCVVSFTIGSDGKVSSPVIVRGAGEAFDREALRVVGMLPNFEPAIENGKPVPTNYVLPIIFMSKGE